jgi:hypothetical protein
MHHVKDGHGRLRASAADRRPRIPSLSLTRPNGIRASRPSRPHSSGAPGADSSVARDADGGTQRSGALTRGFQADLLQDVVQGLDAATVKAQNRDAELPLQDRANGASGCRGFLSTRHSGRPKVSRGAAENMPASSPCNTFEQD